MLAKDFSVPRFKFDIFLCKTKPKCLRQEQNIFSNMFNNTFELNCKIIKKNNYHLCLNHLPPSREYFGGFLTTHEMKC